MPLSMPAGRNGPLSGAHMKSRRGFTLVELLVTIVVISILLALLLPAINGARRRAMEGRARIDLSQIDAAIAAFKTSYGVEPPSRFILCTNQATWDANPEYKGFVKRAWPQFDFSMPGGRGVAYPTEWGNPGATVQINSGECLLFFLGGIMTESTDPSGKKIKTPIGFSKNPSTPFAPNGTSRQTPFMEFGAHLFPGGRFSDVDNNGMLEYLDSLPGQTKPILYFSSYEGRGYRLAELPSGLSLVDIYRVGTPTLVPGPATQSLPPQKPQSYQLVSPGYDNDYGSGGAYTQGSAMYNVRDNDNITNFANGTLGQ